MNIFYLDSSPVLAAQMQCDKHVVKMVLESTQMLTTACGLHGYIFWKYRPTPWFPRGEVELFREGDELPVVGKQFYKPTYINHPSTH